MTGPFPASVPPGCTATTASALPAPLSLSPVFSSTFAPALVPTSMSGISSHRPVYHNLAVSDPFRPECLPSPVSAPSPPIAPVGRRLPFDDPSTVGLSFDSLVHSVCANPNFLPALPPNSQFGPIPTGVAISMSNSAAAAAAASPAPALHMLSDANANMLKMPSMSRVPMIVTETPVKPPLPSSLIAASSTGAPPQMLPNMATPPSTSSFAAAAAAATAAASASSLPRPHMAPVPLFSSFQSPRLDKDGVGVNGHVGIAGQFDHDSIYRSHDGIAHFQPNQSHMAHPVHTPEPKRLLDAAQLRDRPVKKQKTEESSIHQDHDEPIDLPSPSEMPHVEDDGRKPPFSYATLIGMAILRSQNRRLTLAQIYKWITDHFVHYRNTDSGWQNSIRHNLSLNKAFQKVERPKDDPGKGHYWVIQPGMERQFLKDRPTRRSTVSDSSAPPNSNFIINSVPGMASNNQMSFIATPQSMPSRTPSSMEYSISSRPSTSGPMAQQGHPHAHSLGHGSPSMVASLRAESSGYSPPILSQEMPSHMTAGIPFHNQLAVPESHRPVSRAESTRSTQQLHSSPPAGHILPVPNGLTGSPAMNGSGMDLNGSQPGTRPSSQAGNGLPGMIQNPTTNGTPPSALSSVTFANTQKINGSSGSFADSGYWSSIDSSVQRPTNSTVIVPTETDLRHDRNRTAAALYGAMTKQRGRAEEELARLRGPTGRPDSPTGSNSRWPTASILSSPPSRPENADDSFGNDGTESQMQRKVGPLKLVKPQTSMIDTSCKTPLTPPVMFKKPAPDVPSASPNTSLKNHRESIRQLLGSPDVNLGGIMGDFHNYYDNGLGSSPLKGISPIKFNPEEWQSLRTPVSNPHKGSRLRAEDDGAAYNSSPVRNYSDHHEVYLNLANTPKIYTPESAGSDRFSRFTPDGKSGRLLPPPHKSGTGSPTKSFIFPPPSLKSPKVGRTSNNPFHAAPRLGIPALDTDDTAGGPGHEDGSPSKHSLPWSANERPSATPRTSSSFSFPSLKKSRVGRSITLDDHHPPACAVEQTGRALAEVLGVSRPLSPSPELRGTNQPQAGDSQVRPGGEHGLGEHHASSPRGFDLMKGFSRIGARTMAYPAVVGGDHPARSGHDENAGF